MDIFLSYAPLIIVLIGILHYTRIKMQENGVIYTFLIYLKWFIGVAITMFSFYIIMISGDFMKENNLSVVFSLPIGITIWFIPMHYISKTFIMLEKKYIKTS